MSDQNYNAEAIEVLNGLDPVKRRPGMYTDTVRPNHLGQEVIDNSVDEAMAGHATKIDVILHEDNSLEVSDDGRGMPIDIHPEEGIPGIELIFTKLHAGGKFSNKNYQFSGGLHGVGSVIELTYQAQRLIGSTYKPLEVFTLSALMYIVIIYAVMGIVEFLYRRATRYAFL